jgi:hypothetical protein
VWAAGRRALSRAAPRRAKSRKLPFYGSEYARLLFFVQFFAIFYAAAANNAVHICFIMLYNGKNEYVLEDVR